MAKPEKCLHCGGEAQIYSHIVFEYRGEDYRKHWNGDKYYVRCESCGIQTQDYYTEQEACDAWNRRAQPEQSQVVHGRWEIVELYGETARYQCTACKEEMIDRINREGYHRYCHKCGAKMEEVR